MTSGSCSVVCMGVGCCSAIFSCGSMGIRKGKVFRGGKVILAGIEIGSGTVRCIGTVFGLVVVCKGAGVTGSNTSTIGGDGCTSGAGSKSVDVNVSLTDSASSSFDAIVSVSVLDDCLSVSLLEATVASDWFLLIS